MFESSAPKYQNLPGLVRKYYVRSEDGRSAGGIYLWQSRAAAEAVYNGEWRERVEKLYGSSADGRLVRHAGDRGQPDGHDRQGGVTIAAPNASRAPRTEVLRNRRARELSRRPLELHGGGARGCAGGGAAAWRRRELDALALPVRRAVGRVPRRRLERAGLHPLRWVQDRNAGLQGLRGRARGFPRGASSSTASTSSATRSAAAWRNASRCIIRRASSAWR